MVRTRRLLVHVDPHVTGVGLWPVQEQATGATIGEVGLVAHDDGAVEIRCLLLDGHRGHGYGTEAARAVLVHAFTQLRLPAVTARVRITDAPALRLVFRIGMRFVRAIGPDDELHELTAERWREL